MMPRHCMAPHRVSPCLYLSFSLSIFLYIYIYIHTCTHLKALDPSRFGIFSPDQLLNMGPISINISLCRFIAKGGITKVPGERCWARGEVFELNAVALAELVGAIDVDVGIEFAQLEFEHPHVAVRTGIVRAPCVVSGRKVIHPTATCAYRLVDGAVGIKPRGASVDMLIGEGPSAPFLSRQFPSFPSVERVQ